MYFSCSKRSIIKSKGSKFRITEGTFALWGWACSIPWEGRKIPLTVIPSATHLCQTTGAWLPRYTELARMTVVQALVEIRRTRVREVSVLLRRSSHPLSTTIHPQLSPHSILPCPNPPRWKALSSPSLSQSIKILWSFFSSRKMQHTSVGKIIQWIAINFFFLMKQKIT